MSSVSRRASTISGMSESSRRSNDRRLGTTQNAGVLESSAAVYAESTVQWREWLRTVVGLREDQFDFDVKDKMLNPTAAAISPAIRSAAIPAHAAPQYSARRSGLVLGPWAKTTYFIDLGDGYHSNDARGVTRSGENPGVLPVTPLTRATSAELGLSSLLVPDWQTTLDVFRLKLKIRTGVRWRCRGDLAQWRDDPHRARVGQYVSYQPLAVGRAQRRLYQGPLRPQCRSG